MGLAEKKAWREFEDGLAQCKGNTQLAESGLTVTFEVDQETLAEQDKGRMKPFCDSCVYGVFKTVSRGEDEKEAVIDAVKTIRFTHGAERCFSLADGVLTMALDFTGPATYMSSYVDKWLMDNL